MKKYIAVAGNIGVGKSTLVTMLSNQLDWQPFYEPVSENPYLADFYRDMSSWAFHSQIFFLTRRLHAHRQLVNHPTSAIQDRTVYEDAEIFAHNLYEQGYINQRDYHAYQDLYLVLTDFLPPPDLVIFLRASVPTLLERIKLRGRDYERKISKKYLEQLIAVLRSAGFVRSIRGSKGGYLLAKEPDQIVLNGVSHCLEGNVNTAECVEDENYCGRAADCAARQVWTQVQRAIEEVLQSITLQDLVDSAKNKEDLNYQI